MIESTSCTSLGACTAQVTNPTKTLAEQQADIHFCTSQASHKYWMDPIAALYQCGSGTHPGGGVTGAPGCNAAREILRDARRGRLR